MTKTAFITGATSGIGKATAEAFANYGFNLVICGRRLERLKNLQKALSAKVKVHILSFDVRNSNEVIHAILSLPAEFKSIDILVNNAGNAVGFSPLQDGKIADWDYMIDTNVKGLLYVSKAIISGMIERKAGHIVNISSIAGKEVYANGNVYCASKHAVDAITKGMRLDLYKYGIKITSINPGMVETEFSIVRFNGDEARAAKVYEGVEPLKAEDIADTILFAVTRPAHVQIADLTILAAAQGSASEVNRNI
ncbi:MAG: SDR family NAD(P)-dependent oxidoreductase [Cytophagales bacterium]